MEQRQGITLRLHGELDDEACAGLRRQLAPALADGLRHLVLDVSRVTSVKVEGMHLLRSLDTHLRQQGGGLVLLRPSEEVVRTLRTYDLEGLLQLRDLEPQSAPRPRPRRPQEPVAGVVPLVRRA